MIIFRTAAEDCETIRISQLNTNGNGKITDHAFSGNETRTRESAVYIIALAQHFRTIMRIHKHNATNIYRRE